MEKKPEPETFGLPLDLTRANQILRDWNNALMEENKRLRSLEYGRSQQIARLDDENRNLRKQLEILKNRPKGKRGRPENQGGYESALLIETLSVLHEWNRDVPTVSEQEAAVIADKRIRERAKEMHAIGAPCEFAYISPDYQPDASVIYESYLKAKRACKKARPEKGIPLSTLFPTEQEQVKRGRKPKKRN